jgi:hypothetical protein
MTSPIVLAASRRRFLQYLAGSPLFAPGAISAYAREAASKLPDPMIWAPADGELIKSPQDAINVFDFEPVAHKNVPRRISATWRPASTTRSRCAPTARGS